MGRDVRIDGVGYNADFVKSLTVEEAITEFLQPWHDHIFEGLNKKERTTKIKEIHKICSKWKI